MNTRTGYCSYDDRGILSSRAGTLYSVVVSRPSQAAQRWIGMVTRRLESSAKPHSLHKITSVLMWQYTDTLRQSVSGWSKYSRARIVGKRRSPPVTVEAKQCWPLKCLRCHGAAVRRIHRVTMWAAVECSGWADVKHTVHQ